MNSKCFVIILLLTFFGFSQKKEVKEVWAKLKTDYPVWSNDYSAGEYENICPSTIAVKASSTLNATKQFNYNVENLKTFRNKEIVTAWVEGVEGNGIGERIACKIIDTIGSGEPWKLNFEFTIVNGYAKNSRVWKQNNRVQTFNVYRNSKLISKVHLQDTPKVQKINLINNQSNLVTGDILEFEIIAVYHGAKYNDTAISLLTPNCSP